MLPIELVIFDCDGVLVETERIAVRLNVELGAALGWPLTEAEVIDDLLGRSPATNLERISARLGPERAAVWGQRQLPGLLARL